MAFSNTIAVIIE